MSRDGRGAYVLWELSVESWLERYCAPRPGEMSGTSPGTSRPPWWSSIPFHLFALAALTAYYLAISWRRWPDTLIDFGNDLYRAWRIAQGAVLYRDVDSFYGPLSQHI